MAASGKNYNPWILNNQDFPYNGGLKEKMRYLLKYAVLAPSSLNTQPWKFKLTNNSIVVLADKSRHLKVADPTMRDFYISIGCAITNIIESAKGFSLKAGLRLNNDYRLGRCAEILISKSSRKSEGGSLIDSISHRFSDKGLYNKQVLAKRTYDTLARISNNSCSVILISDSNTRSQIIDLVVEADHEIMSDDKFRNEISRWLIPNFSSSTLGMPGFTMGLNLFQSIISPFMVRNFKKFASLQAKKDKTLLLSSPCFGMIVTKNEDKQSWLEAGMLYEKLCLLATKESVRINPLSAIIECRQAKLKLKTLIKADLTPVLFFRLGYSNNKEIHSPRAGYETLNGVGVESSTIAVKNTENRLIETIPAQLKKGRIRINNYHINYVTAGKGEPLLLLHGGNIGWGQWYPNINDLARHFSVYAIDLPGAGRSTRLDYSRLDLKKDFVDVVDKFIALKNFQKLNILGSSIGGWIALKLALKQDKRINKLVLADCIGFTNHMRIADRILGIYPLAMLLSKTILKPFRENRNIEKFLRDVFYNKSFPISKEFTDYFYETMETSHNLLLISRLSSLWGIRKEFILERELPKIKNEVMVIWGEKDKLLPPNQNYDNFKLIPKVQIEILQGAGHIPSIERDKEFNQLVVRFLKS